MGNNLAPFNIYKTSLKLLLWLLRIVVILIAALVGISFMILQSGFLSDLVVTPWWVKAQRESQQYFAKLQDHRFQAALLDFVVKDENAWGYYQRATESLHDIKHEDIKVIHIYPYSNAEEKCTFADTERVINRYARAFALWDSGTACRYCAIPNDYEKGFSKPSPNYNGLLHLAGLALVNAEVELLKGNDLKAAEIHSKILKMGADVGGGEEVVIGRIVGVMIAKSSVQALKINLNSFNLEAIKSLERDLHLIEGNWPRFDTALEAEGKSYLLPSNTGWDGVKLFRALWDEDGGSITPPFHIQILEHLFAYLFSWRRGFSFRLTTIAISQRRMDLAKRCNAVQKRNWENIRSVIVQADSDAMRDARNWDLTVANAPSYNRRYQRYYESLIALRVIKGGLWLREYKLTNGKFPEDMKSFLASDTSYYDLADSKPLRFLWDSTGQTIRLYSNGLNLKDDKGEGDPKNRFSGEKDDIWVEVR